ncbi:related to SER3-3-phosphoglycerate dehydrogenase [Lecanosticta acicola]|uniref:Related to SER3-3-phosphoglycerate dehydrogenase n=1 Tax=Lecanosticta acicola TaxID=111012 RepID=A0AAI8YYC4_9PEZI|nr:related to SER3-3-phosphoglycerate dehydrogenase [Lecanosticta acicola]
MAEPKPKVFVLNPYHPEALQLLKESPEIESIFQGYSERWQDEADGILLRSESRITAQDLEAAKKLKVIVKQGVGVDNVDVEAARKANVAVCNTPAMNSESVAELTISLALAVARRLVEMDRLLLRGEKLVRSQLLGQSLFQKSIGIVGMGAVGRQVAEKWLGAMKGRVVAYDPFAPKGAWPDVEHRRVADLDSLLDSSDVVTLHVPLTDTTRNMISRRQFKLMKKNAILLNCSRGGIVNEEDLLEALEAKEIFGAALDATEVEPVTLEAYGRHLANDNLILTPHVGASTEENQSASGKFAVQTILDVLAGKDVPNRIV